MTDVPEPDLPPDRASRALGCALSIFISAGVWLAFVYLVFL